MQWREAVMVSLLTWGNSYDYLDWDSRRSITFPGLQFHLALGLRRWVPAPTTCAGAGAV
jgi:hypothetical protein